jgi:hypothetical protein
MSNSNTNITNALATLDINTMGLAELKRTAKALGITGHKDWDEAQWKNSINTRRKQANVARVVDDMSTPIPEGFARIELQSTNDEEKEAPVQVAINGFKSMIPKGVVVDVPTEVVDECLGHSTDYISRRKRDAEGTETTVRVEVKAYPFTEYGRQSGESVIPTSLTKETYSIRQKFREIFHRWPKREEQRKFQDALMAQKFQAMMTGNVDAETAAVLGVKPNEKA